MPGSSRNSTHSGERPASTSGTIEATRANITSPAATDQNSLKLARRSPVHAIRSAANAETSTASSGISENITI